MHLIKNLLLLFIFLLSSIGLEAQSLFKIANESSVSVQHLEDRSIIPNNYLVLQTDFDEISSFLERISVQEKDFKRNHKGISFRVINPLGEIEDYEVFEVKMMEEDLADKYNKIKTYKGVSKSNPNTVINFGINSKGFYATVMGNGNSYSIDRYANNQNQFYISYYHKDYRGETGRSQVCGTSAEEMLEQEEINYSVFRGDNLPLRTYRVAIATTGEFGSFYGPTKEDVLGELVKSINRINQILERDFAIRLLLVNDNDKIIFLDKDTDPYNDGNTGGTLLGQNTNVISSNLGFSNYDIGHVYTRGCDDVGGIAFIRSLCQSNKGGGVTCHYSTDITAMAVRVAAHELGHQLGSNHTFNNCSGNENSGTAYEPGSGSTIMSYGGLCGAVNNVVSTADDYYHVSSIIEITSYTRNGGGDNCQELISTDNHIPDVHIPYEDGFYIPHSTPFELTGEANDMDGDALTFNWEQFNLGPISMLGVPQANSPSFRSIYPSTSPTRVFPELSTLVANQVDNKEVLPTYSRDLAFQFVARDNNLESGGVAWDMVEFEVDGNAGPFLVQFPNEIDTFKVGEEIEVTWDVGNTDNEKINCQSVDIYLSIDGGYTYDYVLLSSTNNDGSEKVFIPNAISEQARIKIKASSNVFFDISNKDFKIEEPDEPGFIFEYAPGYIRNCIPNPISIDITTDSFLGFDEEIKFEISGGNTEGLLLTFQDSTLLPGEGTTLDIEFTENTPSGKTTFSIAASAASDTIYRDVILDLVSPDFSDITPVCPIPGSSGNTISPVIEWTGDVDASSYLFRLSDNPSFDPEQSDVWYEEILIDTFFELDDILSKSTVYYWTITGSNECGSSIEEVLNTFATEALSCSTFEFTDLPAPISASGVIKVEMPIFVNAEGQVSDVNIKKLRGTHGWTSELKGELISPSGIEVLLFDNKCPGQSDFNCGFDVDAVTDITCPLNQGIFYRPQESLDTFNGEEIGGEWLFRLTDKIVGTGGSVQEYQLELCSNAVLENPFLVKNETMPLPTGVGRRISAEFLLSEDNNNSSNELVYTLLSIPDKGTLRKNEDTLRIGNQFTQLDLNEKSIRYQHDGEGELDSFIFVVEDGEGGWIDKTTFLINIDNNVVLDVKEINNSLFNIFPNPNNGAFTLIFSHIPQSAFYNIIDNSGRKIRSGAINSQQIQTFDLGSIMNGIYYVRIYSKEFQVTKKLLILN